jgi:hypothetical protein
VHSPPPKTDFAANITKTFEMASEKQRKMIEYTKKMQISEKKALPSKKRSASR